MRKWRVARVTKDGTLHVAEQTFWTKNGAQAAATHLNTTFGALEAFAAALHGHNFFVVHVDRVGEIEKRLEETK